MLFQLLYPAVEVLAGILAWVIEVLGRLMGQVLAGLQQFGLLGELPESAVPTPTPSPTAPPFVDGSARRSWTSHRW